MYFKQFPTTVYSLDDGATVQFVKNILLRVILSDELKNNFSIFDEYDVIDGETPELVSFKFYGSSEYHWLILHANDIIDPRFEWVLPAYTLNQYVESKYDNPYGIHHYENSEGYVVDSDAEGAVSVSNFTYEDRLNESKRRIRVIKPEYIQATIREFKEKIKA